MESDRNALRDADRAAAMPFVSPPVTPWWYPLLTGAYFTALLAGPWVIFHRETFLGFAITAVAMLAYARCMVWYRQLWGTWPKEHRAPAEIRLAYRWVIIAFAGAALLAVASWLAVGAELALPATFIVVSAITWVYERKIYPAAAQRLKQRLA